ncbi:MAG: flagellar export chaperone FlgN [Acidimicrobiales bacterium]
MAELSKVLWRERRVLAALEFKFEEQRLVAASGSERYLEAATVEVEAVLQQLRELELARAALTCGVAQLLGLVPDASLDMVATSAPGHWSKIFGEHRAALTRAAEDVRQTATSCQIALSDEALPLP